jgi:hypothetical protein
MIQLGTHARITRAGPNSPTLALRHENQCPALEGKPCSCSPLWQLRPAPRKIGGAK